MLAIKGIYDGNNIIPIENITSDGNEIKNEFIRAGRIFDLTGRGRHAGQLPVWSKTWKHQPVLQPNRWGVNYLIIMLIKYTPKYCVYTKNRRTLH